MKKYTGYLLAFFFLIDFGQSQAQIKKGYIFGLNLTSLTLKAEGISSGPKTLASFHFGGALEIPLVGNLTLRPALLLSAKGSDYTIDTVDISIAPIYIEIPVNAVYSFGSDEIKGLLYAGPYIACGIGGYKIISGGELKDINYGSGKNCDLKPIDFGLNVGAGLNIRGFMILAQYGIGLANISPEKAGYSEMKNKVIGISISSLFPSKK